MTRSALLTGLLILAASVAHTQTGRRGDLQVLFDDFTYADFEAMQENGWLARTKKGLIPTAMHPLRRSRSTSTSGLSRVG